MKTLLLSIIVLFGNWSYGQANLDQYKYIIVPKKFEVFKNPNEYQTSTLIKYLLTEKGFNAIYNDELPSDLKQNACLGLTADLLNLSSMFTTKTVIVLNDCEGKAVFKTMEGKSKIKEYKDSFTEAIKKSMVSFNGIHYVYKQPKTSEPVTISFKNDVKKLEDQAPDLKSNLPVSTEKEVQKEDHPKEGLNNPKNSNPAVVQEATTDKQLYKSVEPEPSAISKKEKPMTLLTPKKPEPNDVWYAQSIPNGYQLVDKTPKIQMKLLRSSADNVFMAQKNGVSGMVYQKDGKWVFEYYQGDAMVQEELNIKF